MSGTLVRTCFGILGGGFGESRRRGERVIEERLSQLTHDKGNSWICFLSSVIVNAKGREKR